MPKPKIKTKNRFNPTFFLFEGFVFLVSQALGLFVGWMLFRVEEIRQMIEEQDVSIINFLFSFAVGTTIILLLVKYVKKGQVFKFMFYFLLFFGILSFFDSFLPMYLTIIFTGLLLLYRYFLPSIFGHNLTIVIAISAISAYMGLGLEVWQVIIILVILSVYDYIAVHKTGHMVGMFEKMSAGGAFFAIIIPNNIKLLFLRLNDKIETGENTMFLGTGDIAFPIIFAVASLKMGIIYAIVVIVGAFAGLLGLNIYQLGAKAPKAIAALPPIAGGSLLLFTLVFLVDYLIKCW